MKKIRRKIHYFGRWAKVVNGKLVRIEDDGWKAALALYKEQADDLHAGRKPRKPGDDNGLTVKELCNLFLTAKTRKLDAGELARRTFAELNQTTDRLVRVFGKERLVDDLAAGDFEALRADIAKTWGPVRLGNEITRVRSIFRYGYATGKMTTDPDKRYGSEFVKPSATVLRKHRAAKGKRMLDADELHLLLDAATPQLKAMILVGVNSGFGNHDVATLPISAVDLDAGWIDYPRPKTGIARRCPLWPETVTAIRESIAAQPAPRQDAAKGLVFVTARGRQWLSSGIAHPVAAAVGALMKTAGINRRGVGFYTLRHVFRTIADGSRDQVAVNLIMGHADDHKVSGGVYREFIDDSRLVAVTEHVRAWLFPKPAQNEPAEPPAKPARQRRPKSQPAEKSAPALRLFAG